jgi:hypothetical protein
MTANNPPALAFNSGYAFQIDGDTHADTSPDSLVTFSFLKGTNKELIGQGMLPVGHVKFFAAQK